MFLYIQLKQCLRTKLEDQAVAKFSQDDIPSSTSFLAVFLEKQFVVDVMYAQYREQKLRISENEEDEKVPKIITRAGKNAYKLLIHLPDQRSALMLKP
jgi:hypothetical protein